MTALEIAAELGYTNKRPWFDYDIEPLLFSIFPLSKDTIKEINKYLFDEPEEFSFIDREDIKNYTKLDQLYIFYFDESKIYIVERRPYGDEFSYIVKFSISNLKCNSIYFRPYNLTDWYLKQINQKSAIYIEFNISYRNDVDNRTNYFNIGKSIDKSITIMPLYRNPQYKTTDFTLINSIRKLINNYNITIMATEEMLQIANTLGYDNRKPFAIESQQIIDELSKNCESYLSWLPIWLLNVIDDYLYGEPEEIWFSYMADFHKSFQEEQLYMISFTGSSSYSRLDRNDNRKHMFIIKIEKQYPNAINPHYLRHQYHMNHYSSNCSRNFEIRYSFSTKKNTLFDRLYFSSKVNWNYMEELTIQLYKDMIPSSCANDNEYESFGYANVVDFLAIPLYPINRRKMKEKTAFEDLISYYINYHIESDFQLRAAYDTDED